MAQDNVIEGNKLIASFMGLHHPETKQMLEHWMYPKGKEKYSFTDHTLDAGDLEYHSSWDWLMYVVEKIEKMDDHIVKKVYIQINGNNCSVWNYFEVKDPLRVKSSDDERTSFRMVGKTKIEAVYMAVVQFIQWYNNQKS